MFLWILEAHQGGQTGWLGRQDSNLGMAESKSGRFDCNINAHSEKRGKFNPLPVNSLAALSECRWGLVTLNVRPVASVSDCHIGHGQAVDYWAPLKRRPFLLLVAGLRVIEQP
jgi:hypothetical protein